MVKASDCRSDPYAVNIGGSNPSAPINPCRRTGISNWFRPSSLRVRISPGVRSGSPIGRGNALKPRTVEVQILPGAPSPPVLTGKGNCLKSSVFPVQIRGRALQRVPLNGR